MIDVAVVGAGAAGLMAGIFAARGGTKVIVLEGARKIGAKILISGGGRCNVTHHAVDARDFNGASRNAIAKVLRSFSVQETIAFFADLDVELKREETGKLFPVSDRAKTIVDALLRAAADAGVEVRTSARVHAINRSDALFAIVFGDDRQTVAARRVILASGGRSVPKTGSDGFGYTLAQSLGHSVTETFPALVPLLLPADHWMTSLSGASVDAALELRAGSGKVLHRDRGSLLFTHFGLSGPPALDVSRHWIAARRDDPQAHLVLRLFPDETSDSLERFLLDEARRNPRATIASVVRGRAVERVIDSFGEAAGLSGALPLVKLTKEQRRGLVAAFTAHPLPVIGDRGFDYAEVTAGGVPLTEVDVATMASRITPSLYLCGEILDVDGRIGGFNFQWAWASGRLAGMSAAASRAGDPSFRA